MKKPVLTAVLLLFHLLSSPQIPPAAVLTTLVNGPKGIPGIAIQISGSGDLSNLKLEWELLLNGLLLQHGKVPVLTPIKKQTLLLHIPARIPTRPGEVLLNLVYRLKKPEATLPAGAIVTSAQLPVRQTPIDLSVTPAGELSFTDEGGTFTIRSAVNGLDLQFNKQSGWLQHYTLAAHSMIQGNPGLGTDFTIDPKLQLFSTSTSTDLVVVKADYLLPEIGCSLHVRYTVNAKGEIQVEQTLEKDSTQPADTTSGAPKPTMPPLFGMQWPLPTPLDSVSWYGDGPKNIGIYRQAAGDSATRTGIRWWKTYDQQGHGMQIMAGSSFLHIRLDQTKLTIDHTGQDAERYHYIYKVIPL